MGSNVRSRTTTAVFAALFVCFLVFSALFAFSRPSFDKGFPENFMNLPWNSGQNSAQQPSEGAPTVIPSPVSSAEAQDQAAQLEAQLKEQEKAALDEQQAQKLGQLPIRFECTVSAIRTGENRSLLRVSVSAPSEIPEVWVTVKTERGNLDGSILMTAGSGQQVIPLSDASQGFRPTVKVYSLPVFADQYEMCSYR